MLGIHEPGCKQYMLFLFEAQYTERNFDSIGRKELIYTIVCLSTDELVGPAQFKQSI